MLKKAKEQGEELRQPVDWPAYVALSGKKKATRQRVAAEKQQRLEQAMAQFPELKQKQAEAAQRAGQGQRGQPIGARQPRGSTTDAEARGRKMPKGGFNPAVHVQWATDTQSRALVGVEVSHAGSDQVGLSEPLRQQVEERRPRKLAQHRLDGGYVRNQDLEPAQQPGVEWFVPPKPSRRARHRGRALEPKRGDREAVRAWKQRMASDEGKEIYKQRAATSATVNADLRSDRGLTQITVRGLPKAKCVALWCALAYNVMHFATALLA